MRWTRVVALTDFEEGDVAVYKMPKDIQDAIKQMDEIDLNTRPRLHVHFDPIKWLATNPMQHPTVYQLNQDQLKGWGEEATEIRRKILLKAENYESIKACLLYTSDAADE